MKTKSALLGILGFIREGFGGEIIMKDEKIERIFLLVWMLAWSLWEYSVHGVNYTPSENGIFIYSAILITISAYYYFTGLVILIVFSGVYSISEMLERMIKSALKKI